MPFESATWWVHGDDYRHTLETATPHEAKRIRDLTLSGIIGIVAYQGSAVRHELDTMDKVLSSIEYSALRLVVDNREIA